MVFDRHRLKALRHAAGLSAAVFARTCGVAKVQAYSWENGRTKPTIDRLPVIVAALGLGRIDELFGPIDQAEAHAQTRCTAMTVVSRLSEQCRQDALIGSLFCSLHQGCGNGAE